MTPSAHLRVSLVQSDLHWEKISDNLAQFSQKVLPLTGTTDLIVLPEMFTTGFSMNPKALAEKMDGQSVHWMKETAKQVNATLCGSLIIEEDGHYYNRMICVHPNEQLSTYDKRHLFTYAKENEHYTAGTERLTVDIKGWKMVPLICYDLRFPVWARNNNNYDLLVYVANWPAPRRNAWKSLLIGRAIENQAYTIGVNRTGIDGTGAKYKGDSSLIDYAGEVLLRASHNEGILTSTLNYSEQQAFRNKLNFLADQDIFEIK